MANKLGIPSNFKRLVLQYKVSGSNQAPLTFQGAQIMNFDQFEIPCDTSSHNTVAGEVFLVYDTIELLKAIDFEIWGDPKVFSRLVQNLGNNINNRNVNMVLDDNVAVDSSNFREQYIFSGKLGKVSPPKKEFKGNYGIPVNLIPETITYAVNGIETWEWDITNRKIRVLSSI